MTEKNRNEDNKNDEKGITSILIKKYANRKLYDTFHRTYITLDELDAFLLREDVTVRVIDNESGEDLTESTIARLLLKQHKKKERSFKELLQGQANLLLKHISDPIQQIRAETLRHVDELVIKPSADALKFLKDASDEKFAALLLTENINVLTASLKKLESRIDEVDHKLDLLIEVVRHQNFRENPPDDK